MRVRLMYPNKDFSLDSPPSNLDQALATDLGLGSVVEAMGAGDPELTSAAHAALRSMLTDVDVVRYRQQILEDCIANGSVVKEAYELAVQTLASQRGALLLGTFGRTPGSTLYRGLELARIVDTSLRRLRAIADQYANSFRSNAFQAFFKMIHDELTEDFFSRFEQHRRDLRFPQGILLSAKLARGNQGTAYALCRSAIPERGWLLRRFAPAKEAYTFTVHERDESGLRALAALNDRGIALVADALARSMEHMLAFFKQLQTELGFWIGCLNLRAALLDAGFPACMPEPLEPGSVEWSAEGLYDLSLAHLGRIDVVDNDLDAAGTSLITISGANRGGKSTFLRSLGIAQLMMQCGMFVPASQYRAALRERILTHYSRDEDPTMVRGRLDEELARMSVVVDAAVKNSLVLLNESFSSTNEREASEIASHVIRALVERGVTICYVTHLHEFVRRLQAEGFNDTRFLVAERRADGTRTFKIFEGKPTETSYARDLDDRIFGLISRS